MASSAKTRWLLASGLGLVLFLLVAADVGFHGALARADDADDAWVMAHAGPAARLLAVGLSDAGSVAVVAVMVIVVAASFLARGRRADALRVVAAGLAVEISVEVLKRAFARPRPASGLVAATGYSFPSGHATAAAMLACLLIGYGTTATKPRLPILLLSAGVTWALLVAWSRVALGVHHVTDVIAGLGLGVATTGAILATRGRA